MESRYTANAGKEWFEYLSENCLGSSGWGGNLIGMRKHVWSKTALVVRCCRYLFWVNEGVFNRVIGKERE